MRRGGLGAVVGKIASVHEGVPAVDADRREHWNYRAGLVALAPSGRLHGFRAANLLGHALASLGATLHPLPSRPRPPPMAGRANPRAQGKVIISSWKRVMRKRIVLLYLPSWPTDRVRRMTGSAVPPVDAPLVLSDWEGAKRVFTAVDAAAHAAAQAMGLPSGCRCVPFAAVMMVSVALVLASVALAAVLFRQQSLRLLSTRPRLVMWSRGCSRSSLASCWWSWPSTR